MKRNFDKILLGLLWLMTVALATTFWMNIKYGFDIFSAAHWEYLSGLQARQAHVKPEFYISLVCAISVAVVGLYLLVRPRFRKIQIQPQNAPQQIPTTPTPTSNVSGQSDMGMVRPRSPISGSAQKIKKAPISQPQQQLPTPTQRIEAPQPKNIPQNNLAKEITSVFESNGYLIKPCTRIGKLNEPILALGYNQTLWVGASDTSVEIMQQSIQTLLTVFEDTLGDTANDLTVHGCIINPSDTENTDPDLISTFSSTAEFSQYMNQNKNVKPDDFDKDLFDAISTYISTVANYIGKE